MFSLGFGITIPAVPLFARDIGATYMGVGLIGVAYGLSYTILALPLGRLSDRAGRKAIMAFSSILSIAASLLYLVASRSEHLILIRAVEGVAWAGYFPAVEASSADISTERRHGAAMGLFASLYGAGFALGSLISGSIVEAAGYRVAFLFYSLTSCAGLIFAITQKPRSTIASTMTFHSNIQRTNEKNVGHALFYACLLSATYSIVLATILFLFPAYARDIGFGIFAVGAMLTSFWISRIASFLTLGNISDRLGRRTILLPALVAMTIASIIMILSDFPSLLLSIIILGISTGAIFPVTIALISDKVATGQRGTAMGYFETASAAGQTIAPLVGGFLAQTFDPRSPFVFCAIISVSCAIVIFKMVKPLEPLLTT
jgi:MFS family permease